MDWKKFLKPTWQKIALAIILIMINTLLLQYALTQSRTCSGRGICFFSPFDIVLLALILVSGLFSGFSILLFFGGKADFLAIMLIIMSLTYVYLFSCYITKVYRKKFPKSRIFKDIKKESLIFSKKLFSTMRKILTPKTLTIIGIISIIIIGLYALTYFQDIYSEGISKCVMRCSITYEKSVAWAESPDIGSLDNIYYINFSTGKKITVVSQVGHVMSISKYEDKVIWVDDRVSGSNYKGWTMYMKDLSTGEEKILLSSRADELKFYGDNIVFTTRHMIDGDNLYLYNLKTEDRTLLEGKPKTFECLDLYEDKLIYVEAPNSFSNPSGIYLYDLNKNTRIKIDTAQETQTSCPRIYKDRIVYIKNNRIYLYNITKGDTSELIELGEPITEYGQVHSSRVVYLRLHEDKVKYLRRVHAWVGPDNSQEFNTCYLIDIPSKGRLDITCNSGILSWI